MPTITSLYRQLFGKRDPVDGDVISMSEHGRVGGVSTGQGFKFADSIKQAIQIDTSVTNVVYLGYAAIGSSTGASVWQILKINTSSGAAFTWADGDSNFDNEWDERTNLSYS